MTLPFAPSYAFPPGGLPPMTADPAATTAIFTTAYAVIPAGVMRDIVTSYLPGWTDTRAWIIARPLSGFAETFAQYAVEVAPHGGSTTPEPDPQAEGWLFIAGGEAVLTIADLPHILTAGGYAHLSPGTGWTLRNPGSTPLRVHWIRRRYTPAPACPPLPPSSRRTPTSPSAGCPAPTYGAPPASSTPPTCATTPMSTSSPSCPAAASPLPKRM